MAQNLLLGPFCQKEREKWTRRFFVRPNVEKMRDDNILENAAKLGIFAPTRLCPVSFEDSMFNLCNGANTYLSTDVFNPYFVF